MIEQAYTSKESSKNKFSDRKNSFLKDKSQALSGPPPNSVTTFDQDIAESQDQLRLRPNQ